MSHWELSKTIFKRYGKNGMLIAFFQALTVLVQLLVVPFLARVLPQAEFGILQFSQTLLTWFAIFSVGNSTFGAKRGMISGKEGTMWHVYLYRMRFMVLLFFACALAAVVLFLVGKPYLPEVCMIVGLFFLFGYLPQVTFPQIFIAKNSFGWFVFWQSLALVVSQGLSLLVAFLTKDILLIMAVQYASFALICILGFVHSLKLYRIRESYQRGEIDHESITYGKKLIPVEILQGTAGTLQNFIIGPLFGFANFAVFSIASRIDALFRSLSSSGYYLLYSDIAKADLGEIKKQFKQKFFFLLTISGTLSLLLFLFATVYIHIFLPPSYSLAILYSAILVCGLPAVFLQSLVQSILESRLDDKSLRSSIYASQILRLGLLALGTFWGVIGISVAITVSSWLSSSIFLYLFFRKKVA